MSSLKCMLKKLVHKSKISEEEYDELIKKLDGHDKEIADKAIAGMPGKCYSQQEIINALKLIKSICSSMPDGDDSKKTGSCYVCPFGTKNGSCNIIGNSTPIYWKINEINDDWRAL